MTLSVSKGVSERVSEQVVRAEPQPVFTESWHPFSHAVVLDAVAAACKKFNLTVERKEYSIRKNSKMFASWEVRSRSEVLVAQKRDFTLAIGIRNSIDKTHSVGLCAGERITVCDNLMFSGDFVIFRKHTGRLEIEEIQFFAEEALDTLLPKMNQFHKWHEKLKATKITYDQASLLTVAAMKQDLIPSSKFPQFYDLFYVKESRYATTLHGWHGAATEIMRENSLLTIQWKNERLNKFIDYQVPLLLTGYKDLEHTVELAEESFQKDKGVKKVAARAMLTGIREKAKEIKSKKKADEAISKEKKKATVQRSEECGETISRSRKKDTKKEKKAAQSVKKSGKKEMKKKILKTEDFAKDPADKKILKDFDEGVDKFTKKLGKFVDKGMKTQEAVEKSIMKCALKKCPFCNATIVSETISCPACGANLD